MGSTESSPKTFNWLGLNVVRERLLKRRGAVGAKRTLNLFDFTQSGTTRFSEYCN